MPLCLHLVPDVGLDILSDPLGEPFAFLLFRCGEELEGRDLVRPDASPRASDNLAILDRDDVSVVCRSVFQVLVFTNEAEPH